MAFQVMWFEGILLFLVICHEGNAVFDPLFGTNDARNDPSIDITPVSAMPFFGNGAHWDADKSVLYYVDSILGKVFKYFPQTGETIDVFVAFGLGVFVPVKDEDNLYLATSELSVLLVEWDGISPHVSSKKELFNVEAQDRTGFRLNSGKADYNGVFYTGTFGKIILNLVGIETVDPGKAALYQYRDTGGTCEVKEVVSNAGAVVDVAWSPDNTIMYYLDILTRCIEAFDYDLATATMTNRRTVFNITENGFTDNSEHLVLPVSVIVDDEGNLWSSIYGVGKVIKVSPDGKLLEEIYVPTILPSLAIWGGDDMTTLYLTSVPILLKPLDIITNLRATSVFAIEGTGARGVERGSFEATYCHS